MAVRNPQLLDTGTVSNLLGLPQGKVAKRITKVGEVKVCTSIVVACELRFGAAMNAQFDAVLSARDVSQCEEPAAIAMPNCGALLIGLAGRLGRMTY